MRAALLVAGGAVLVASAAVVALALDGGAHALTTSYALASGGVAAVAPRGAALVRARLAPT